MPRRSPHQASSTPAPTPSRDAATARPAPASAAADWALSPPATRAPGQADGDAGVTQLLADGCGILGTEGQGDIIWGHVSCRVPGDQTRLYMKPATLGLEEIAPADLIQIDLAGRKVAGDLPVHSEVFIHTEVLRARPEVACVVHTHPPYAVAFGATGQPLRPIGHDGAYFEDNLAVFTDTTDLIVTRERGEAVAHALGQRSAVLLRNHGIVTVGRTIQEAVFVALLLEKACYMQLLAQQMGGAIAWTEHDEALIKQRRIYRDAAMLHAFAYYARKLHARRLAEDAPA